MLIHFVSLHKVCRLKEMDCLFLSGLSRRQRFFPPRTQHALGGVTALQAKVREQKSLIDTLCHRLDKQSLLTELVVVLLCQLDSEMFFWLFLAGPTVM